MKRRGFSWDSYVEPPHFVARRITEWGSNSKRCLLGEEVQGNRLGPLDSKPHHSGPHQLCADPETPGDGKDHSVVVRPLRP